MFEDLESRWIDSGQHDLQQRAFLDKYVFHGLNRLKVNFDAETIAHFRAEDFLQVLERCYRFQVTVPGIEIFTADGDMLMVEILGGDSPLYFMPIVLRFCNRQDISIAATFSVPDSLLTEPAISDELVAAYTACEYTINLKSKTAIVRVSESCQDVQKIITDQQTSAAFIITAADPFSVKRNHNLNRIQNDILRERLERMGANVFESKAAAGTQWEEAGFLAVGVAEEDVHQLGIEFGQNAVITIPCIGIAELLLLR